ncbi:MAG: putative toxin-antitoxin system toxin component, PIN family [Candidatus Levybacteria bacterium]|nr:putative toxin-antitoxin system toxin component, PIN family [Candidatus Levybacteria bacterium]
MHKAVVDTNVFISSILFGGNPQRIIEAWLNQKYIFCLSPQLKAEILNKLQKKFLLSNQKLQDIEEALDAKTEKYIPKKKLFICKDAADNFLIELAQEAQANYLISGDKLVLKIRQYNKTQIISPKDFLESL